MKDPAFVAATDMIAAYEARLEVDESESELHLSGGLDTCSLRINFESDRLDFLIGEATRYEAFLGDDADLDDRVNEGVGVLREVLAGAVTESIWIRADEIVKAVTRLTRLEHNFTWQRGLLPLLGRPTRINRYSAYKLRP